MSRHTSKSVSASPRTSSRSGGSARTGATAKTRTKALAATSKFASALTSINGMSTAEFRETLVRLGISKPDGTLTAKYASGKRSTKSTDEHKRKRQQPA